MAPSSHGTHQLELSFRSPKVLRGAIKTSMSRCISDSLGCSGSTARGAGAGAGGGGVKLLIYHPYERVFKKLCDSIPQSGRVSSFFGEVLPAAGRHSSRLAIFVQNLYCRPIIF